MPLVTRTCDAVLHGAWCSRRWYSWHQPPSARPVTLAHLLPALSQLWGNGCVLSGACPVLLGHLSRWHWCVVLPWEKRLSFMRSDNPLSNKTSESLEALLSMHAHSDLVIAVGDGLCDRNTLSEEPRKIQTLKIECQQQRIFKLFLFFKN